MNPEQLAAAIRRAITSAHTDGAIGVPAPKTVPLDRPRSREHGDYATPVALQLAKKAQLPPRQLAEQLRPYLAGIDGIADVQIAGPGFLNLTLQAGVAGALVGQILAAGSNYGLSQRMAGTAINLEFVSANPTGPIHLGGARWAAVGDVLGRIFTTQGAEVTREYYFNDAGAQIDRFARSLQATAAGKPLPEDGYVGEYITEIATKIVAEHPEVTDLPDAAAQEVFRSVGVTMMFAEIKKTLHDFRTDFDVYFHEDSLHRSGAVAAAVDRLKNSGDLAFADGAWWLKSTAFGDDKDRVVIKSDGTPAYVAGDLAYFLDKRSRGFDLCIYMLGADHHGYIARLKAAAAAFGDDPNTVEVMIGQMVHLAADGHIVRMSKRAGNVITLDDLIADLGVDAARYALSRYSVDTTLMLDIAEWTRQSNENPVFYVQYAHARLASIARNAADCGIHFTGEFDPALLDTAAEEALIAQLAAYPRILATAADLREGHRVCRYLEDLAAAYHKFYDAVRVLPMGEEPATPATYARLALCAATRQVLANGLAVLGVSAPERM